LLPLPAPADNAAMQAESPKPDPPKRKRRWVQFSLRSLLIGVTLFCVVVGGYVGWQAKVVRERKAMLDSLDKSGGGYVGFLALGNPQVEVPAIRHWLGDRAIKEILIRESRFKEQAPRFQIAFPEAD
jgi:hypothetical protein